MNINHNLFNNLILYLIIKISIFLFKNINIFLIYLKYKIIINKINI